LRQYISHTILLMISALLVAIGFNTFLIPHTLLSGGVSGISMIVSYFTPLNQGIMYFVLNLPLLIAGWFWVGRRFIIYTLISISLTSLWLLVIPVSTITSDSLLSAVFGGILVGVGSGIAFKVGGSTGGFDIAGAIITRIYNFPVGMVVAGLNALVVSAIGYMTDDWNLTFYSAICVYLTGKLIDVLHVGNTKITLNIVTEESSSIIKSLRQLPPRGITKIPAQGAYSGETKDVLMMVTTRYELAEIKRVIIDADPNAFVNITATLDVWGSFRE